MIAATPQVGYVQEPFNPKLPLGENPRPFGRYFQYLCEENQGDYVDIFNDIIRFHYPLSHNIGRIRNARSVYRIIQGQKRALTHRRHHSRALIKDPIAFFSSEWLYHTLGMDVVVLVRHPAAFCSSLMLRDWSFDFNHLLDQPLLMARYLMPFEKDIRAYALKRPPLLAQSILLWNIFHSVIQEYRATYDSWLFVKHEDLSLEPITAFESLYQSLGLTFSEQAMDAVIKSSGTHNPSEQQAGTVLKKYSNLDVKRNSLANIKNWQKRLTPAEIETIREKTDAIASAFYTDDSWT